MEEKSCFLSWRAEHSWDQRTSPNPVEWTMEEKFRCRREIHTQWTYFEILLFLPRGAFLSRHLRIVIKVNALHPERGWRNATSPHPPALLFLRQHVPGTGSLQRDTAIPSHQSLVPQTGSVGKHLTALPIGLSLWWLLVSSVLRGYF